MPSLPHMTKHRGFPSGLHGTGFQFTIRRANPKGVTAIKTRKRVADRSPMDRKADTAFLHAIWHHFGSEPFERGNLDAGRLSWLFGQEIIAADDDFDPASYEAMLIINEALARRSFPKAFAEVLEV
jgi:hypothetical protein